MFPAGNIITIMKGKLKWIAVYMILGALLAATGYSIYNSIKTNEMLEKINTENIDRIQEIDVEAISKINDINFEAFDDIEQISSSLGFLMQDDVAQEDDVVIAGSYEIKSTLPISDAYKSGDSSQLSDKEKETLDMASEVLDEIIEDGMSDFEKELAVYEWMTSELVYDEGALVVIPTSEADCDNPYGVLKDHNAVCVGYATTFRLFMQMLDIDCMVVHNSELYHSWNLVNLDDEWYHVDIYSDAGVGGYTSFNMNDNMCLANGNTWNTEFFPAANGIKYNMGYQNMRTVSDAYDLPELIRSVFDEKKSVSMFIDFKNSITEEDALKASFILSEIESRTWQDSYIDYIFTYSFVENDDDTYYICISVVFYDNWEDIDGDLDISDEEYEKIYNLIDKFFPYTEYDWDYEYGYDDYYKYDAFSEENIG